MPTGWHHLSADLQQAILVKLGYRARAQVGGVCRAWDQVVRAHQTTLTLEAADEEDWLRDPVAIASLLSAAARRPHIAFLTLFLRQHRHFAILALLLRELPMLQELLICAPVELPAAIVLLVPQLRNLHLQQPESLPDCLGHLTALTTLRLRVAKGAHLSLPSTATRLQQLVKLHVGGIASITFPDGRPNLRGLDLLAALPTLRVVEMKGLFLADLQWVQALTQITRLALKSCAKDGAGAGGDGVEEGEEAAWLEGGVLFTSEECNDALRPLTQLQHLNLGTNRFVELPASVAQLADLHTLSLSGNRGLAALPPGPYQQSLESLDLSQNRSLEAGELLLWLEGMHGLSQLELSGTQLDEERQLEQLVALLPRMRYLLEKHAKSKAASAAFWASLQPLSGPLKSTCLP